MYEELIRNICEALDDSHDYGTKGYNVTYQAYLVERFVNECVEAKRPLIDMLSKHPNWDADTLRIYFDKPYHRAVDTDKAYQAIIGLGNTLKAYAPVVEGRKHDLWKLGWNLIEYSIDLSRDDNIVLEGTTRKFRETSLYPLETARIKDDAKCTKSVGKMLHQYNYELIGEEGKQIADSYFTKYTDALNSLEITRGTVLSLNPADFIRMSVGNSWSSCHDSTVGEYHERHNLKSGHSYRGCYKQGCLSYTMDSSTMIFFTVESGTAKEDLTMAGKIKRELFFWNGEILAPCIIYPDKSCDEDSLAHKEHRAIVEQIIADCLSRPNQWKRLPKISSDYYDDRYWFDESIGAHYRDYQQHSFRAYTFNNFIDEEVNRTIEIGSDRPFCFSCGANLMDNTEDAGYIVCDECRGVDNRVACPCCGQLFDPDEDGHYVDGEDETVCEDCWNNRVEHCEVSDQDYYEEHGEYYDGLGWVSDSHNDEIAMDEITEDWDFTDEMEYFDGVGYVHEEYRDRLGFDIHCGQWYIKGDEYIDSETGEVYCSRECYVRRRAIERRREVAEDILNLILLDKPSTEELKQLVAAGLNETAANNDAAANAVWREVSWQFRYCESEAEAWRCTISHLESFIDDYDRYYKWMAVRIEEQADEERYQ